MHRELKKAEILRLIRQLADTNVGTPPGQERFQKETGIKIHEWRGKIWRTWTDALSEAGYGAREWTGQTPEVDVFRAVASLAERLQRFPNSTDLMFERSNNPDFPAFKTIQNRWTMARLAEGVRKVANDLNDGALAGYCDDYLASLPTGDNAENVSVNPLGYVYMIRYGKDVKIGRTSSTSRRSRQIQIELPEATDLIHAILTDDPSGVEVYWHYRFRGYGGNGEWFRLPPSAIAAFKKWTKIA